MVLEKETVTLMTNARVIWSVEKMVIIVITVELDFPTGLELMIMIVAWSIQVWKISKINKFVTIILYLNSLDFQNV